MTFARPRVLVVGDLMVDVVVKAGALAKGGDVHGEVRLRPGGSGANAAVWAAAAGAAVTLVGRVGDDPLGRLLCESVRAHGVEPHVTIDDAARTGAMLVITEAGERSMVADRGANAHLSRDDLPQTMAADAVLLSGYLVYAEGSRNAALAALDRGGAPTLAVEASSWPLLEAFGPERFLDATAKATLILANQRESEVLFGSRITANRAVLNSRHRGIVIKRGPAGARFIGAGSVIDVPTTAAPEGHDSTGAGDAFDGVLVALLASGMPMGAALHRAVAAGTQVATLQQPWPNA